MMNAIQTQTIEMLREQNRKLLAELASAQEFISAFPTKLVEARLDVGQKRQTTYDYTSHARILAMEGGATAIRSQLNEEVPS